MGVCVHVYVWVRPCTVNVSAHTHVYIDECGCAHECMFLCVCTCESVCVSFSSITYSRVLKVMQGWCRRQTETSVYSDDLNDPLQYLFNLISGSDGS